MTGAVAPYLALVAAGSCIWAMPWVQGPTPTGRSLDPVASSSSAPAERLVIPVDLGASTDPAAAHAEPTDDSAGAPGQKAGGVGKGPVTVSSRTSIDLTTRPEALAIPDKGVRSPVVPVGLDAAGGVAVPEDITVIGWYDRSRPLGAEHGATVLVGHRDSRIQGYGTLYDIESLHEGSKLMVTGRNGTLHIYAVTTIELIDKADLPQRAPEIFTRLGPHRLTLITCGGAFDAAAGNYLSNVVVTAMPIGG